MLSIYSVHHSQHWEEKNLNLMEKLGPFLRNAHRGNLYFQLFKIISRGMGMDYEDFCNVNLNLNLPHTIVFLMCARGYAHLSCRKKPDRGKQCVIYEKDIDRPSLEI